MLTISVDFDGTLIQPGGGTVLYGGRVPLSWRPGAKEGLVAMAAAGHRLVLHSCRCNPIDPVLDPSAEAAAFYRWGTPPESAAQRWAAFGEMKAFLMMEGVWGLFAEVWQAPGKPIAEVYIDDRAESPDWRSLAAEFGIPQPRAAGVISRP